MANTEQACVLCNGIAGDAELHRIQVWEDSLWRLTLSIEAEILGFAYLEPKRHIPHITDLDREEARTFGEVLARVAPRRLTTRWGPLRFASRSTPVEAGDLRPIPASRVSSLARY